MTQMIGIHFYCHSFTSFRTASEFMILWGAKNLASAWKFIKIRSFSRQRRDQDDIFCGLETFPKKFKYVWHCFEAIQVDGRP